jgi:hypothetical protein
MGKKSKSPASPPPQPYLGPGRNATETHLRNKGYDQNLDDQAAINRFLARHFGGALPGIDAAPAPGTVARMEWDKQQTAKQEQERQRAAEELQRKLVALGPEVGYYGEQGSGQMLDYLKRNPQHISTYNARRASLEPGWTGRDIDNYQSDAIAARDRAIQNAQRRVQSRGLNYEEFAGDIGTELDRIYRGISYGARNADNYFDPNLTDSVLSNVESRRRSQYQSDVGNYFKPNYSFERFVDTSDDETIEKILDEQYGQAESGLKAHRDRGQLLDSGYDAALQEIGKQRQVASSRLQELGGRVLTRNRAALDDISSRAQQGASSYRLGQSFDPSTFRTQAESKTGELRGRLESDIRSELGGENLFDVTSVLQRGFQQQGAQNTGRSGILDLLAQRDEQRKQQRGVGSEGAF